MLNESCDILVSAENHQRIIAHLFPGEGNEHGMVLHAGIVRNGSSLRLLIQSLHPAESGTDYVSGQYGYKALAPTFIHRQILQCRDSHLAYLAIHNHMINENVKFSKVDWQSHERGYPALLDVGRGIPVGALVYGQRSVAADVWMPDGTRRALGSYRIIGQNIEWLCSKSNHQCEFDGEHDRQIRMFGVSGQQTLSVSKVAVVGLGGIGSLVSEYLARLGVGQLLLIDHDIIELSNLSRVVGATHTDVRTKQPKAKIAVRHAREIASDAELQPIIGDVAQQSVAELLRDCDFIFLAADSMRSRLVVNALAHQYLIPTIQIGTKVRQNQIGEIEDAMSVVRAIRPGIGCLWCNGLIDPTQLAIEAKSDQERKQQAYGINEPNPSVITMNAVAAAHAVNDFMFDYLGLRYNSDDAYYEHFHFHHQNTQRAVPRKDSNCNECVHRLAMGDALPLPVTEG